MLLKDEGDIKKNIVKNFDTFSTFVQKYIRQASDPTTKRKNVLYVHSPFCLKKCGYCICPSVVNANAADRNDYLNNILLKQISGYADIFRNVHFDEVYFGGGTPTLWDVKQLERIFNAIPGFESIPVKCMEASPQTLQREHLDLLRKYHFQFLSVGIQSLDRMICEKQNRMHISKQEFLNMSRTLMETGIYFNYDLICFMNMGDVRDLLQFEKELLFIMRKGKPSFINIQQLHQSQFTYERTQELIRMIRDVLKEYPEYSCVNALLRDGDCKLDTLYQANYRLARDNKSFFHHLWSKHSSLPARGCNTLSIGWYGNLPIVSNAGDFVYLHSDNTLQIEKNEDFFYTDFWNIREELGLI